jgi:uncharacterized RDD family membrane protein YckC
MWIWERVDAVVGLAETAVASVRSGGPAARKTDLIRRVDAGLIDGLCLWLFGRAWHCMVAATGADGLPHWVSSVHGLGWDCSEIALWVLCWLYFTVSQAAWSRTIGKWAMGLKLVDGFGHRPGTGIVAIRVTFMFLFAAGGIAWWPLLGRRRSAIHDYLTETYVVPKDWQGPAVEGDPPAPA